MHMHVSTLHGGRINATVQGHLLYMTLLMQERTPYDMRGPMKFDMQT